MELFEGLIICLLGTIIGTVIIYSFLNKYGIKFINKFYDTSKINQIKFLKKKTFRNNYFHYLFIPGTPKDLITYLAPFTRLKLTTFLAISSIARIPSIITSTISGSALSNQNYQLTIWVFIITGIISILGLLIYKFYVHKKIFRKSFESFLSFLIYKHYNVDIKGRNVKMNQDNILVVEDEIEIAKAIEIYLKSQNYNVYIANNGLEAS